MFMPHPTNHLSPEQQLQLLMDEREIRNVIYRDSRAKGRCDVELMKTCFHEDAKIHFPPRAEDTAKTYAEWFEEGVRAAAEMIQYFAPQILIEVSGDIARSESYVVSAKTFHERAESGDKVMRLSGMRFLDRFERRDGEWRIAERWFIPEWGFFQQVPPLTKAIGPYGAGTETGNLVGDPTLQQILFARDRTDLSYRF